ncbi:sugar ABC transporter substrate-binding protein [Homoserinibacter sp. GY 40078]|uniref:sugar ABC transporter substrate-binding protein n=1 Tax=Homoserinibacter sp. GY 40078 TaxID=2603275 RepID=UPI00165004F1|nr:sugar ABC transporter substrate-binding protein [Homoserinibacter sp. GY 40078]
MKKWMTAAASLAVAALALAGCSSGDDPNGGDDTVEVGIITFSATDVAVNNLVRGAEEQAEALGYTTSVVDSNGSVDQANTAMQNLAQKGVDAILVTVWPSSALASGLASASAAGIPVVTLGGGLADGVKLSVDDSLNEPVAEYVMGKIQPGADVLKLTYRSGRPCQLREDAFDAAVADQNYTVTQQEVTIPGQVESSQAATVAWLAANQVAPGTSAIWTCWDDSALGAIAGLKQQGLEPGDVLVTGTNGTKEALTAIQEGWLTVTLWIDHYGAGKQLVDGIQEILAAGDGWEDKEIEANYEIVDASNVDQFIADHPEITG